MPTPDEVCRAMLEVTVSKPIPVEKWMTRAYAASVAGVCTKTIDRAVRTGRIRVHRVNCREVWLWREDVVALRAVPSCPEVSTPDHRRTQTADAA